MKKLVIIFKIFSLLTLFACDSISDRLGFKQPKIVSVNPTNSMENVSEDTEIRVTFSESMDINKTNESFSLNGSSSGAIEGFYSWEENNKTLVFKPKNNLSSTEYYTIQVTTNAEDVEGNDIKKEFTSLFYLSNDFDKPSIENYTPANDALGVAEDSTIEITFSESISTDTIFDGISISPAVEGQFTWNSDQTIITFTPLYPFKLGTNYTVSVNSSIKDLNNNALTEELTYNFTVGNDFTNPTITSIQQDPIGQTTISGDTVNSPSWLENQLNYGAENNNNIVITFDEPVKRETILDAISISPAVDYYVQCAAEDTVVTLMLNKPLESETIYTITISSSVTDVQNNYLDKEYIYRFYTNGDNSIRPTIDHIEDDRPAPTNVWDKNYIEELLIGALNYVNVDINFSRKINPTTVLITIQREVGPTNQTPKVTNFRWDTSNADFDILTIDLDNVYPGNTYKIVINGGKTGVEDVNGNYMKEDYVQYIKFP